jgi:hypothetical protein
METPAALKQWLDWPRFHEAVELVRQHRPGFSYGKAGAIVKAAYASGEVRFRERIVKEFKPSPAESVVQGFESVVEYSGMKVTGINKKVRHLNKDDLLHWLDQHEPLAVASIHPAKSNKRSRATPKQERAQQAIRALYNGNVPPMKILPNSSLCGDVNNWLKKDCEQRRVPLSNISDDTILRAAGRK